MLFGPIVHAEMVRIGRQRRWYVLRVALGLGLLLVCQQGYATCLGAMRSQTSEIPESVLQWMAFRVLILFVTAQSAAVLILTPILLAGSVAEEKQRKTLHYLLSSRLGGLEIVVGKILARLLLVLVPIAIALPVVVLLSFLGGVEPIALDLVYGATLTTAVFEASMAVLVSTLAPRTRDALLMTLLATIAWFFGPFLLQNFFLDRGDSAVAFYERWVQPWNDHLLALGPLSIPTRAWGWPTVATAIARMLGHQAVASAFLIGLATWQLRPAFRRQDGAGAKRRPSLNAIRRRWRPRPPVGDDAMLWKETHGLPGAGLSGLVAVAAIATIAVGLYEPLKEVVPRAWLELKARGYGVGRDDPARQELSTLIRVSATGLFCVWSLLLMVQAATSISREREDDTWTSLVATPLSGREILRAKMLGAVWAARYLAYAIAALWAFGLVMGSLHPAGLAISAAQLVAFGLAIVGSGTLISAVAKTTARAIGLGVAGLLAAFLLIPQGIEATSGTHGRMRDWACSPPALLAIGMLNRGDVRDLLDPSSWPTGPVERRALLVGVATIVAGSLSYIAAGPILLAVAARRFDRLLDRPRRRIVKERGVEATAAAPAGAATAGLPAGRA